MVQSSMISVLIFPRSGSSSSRNTPLMQLCPISRSCFALRANTSGKSLRILFQYPMPPFTQPRLLYCPSGYTYSFSYSYEFLSCLLIFGLRSTLLPSLPYFNCTKNPRYDCPEIFSIQGTKLTPWLFADSQICLL